MFARSVLRQALFSLSFFQVHPSCRDSSVFKVCSSIIILFISQHVLCFSPIFLSAFGAGDASELQTGKTVKQQ